jgi:Raf kinase inhibitor-like YbhB/YbcL family protein
VTGSRGLLGITLVLVGIGSLAACTSGGTTSTASATNPSPPSQSTASQPEPPSPSASSVLEISPTPSSANPSSAGSPAMHLTSTAFADGGAIPRKFTCDGEDVSPPLAWDGVPADATVLVLIVDDPDARDFVHWVVFDIRSAPTGELAEGASTADRNLRQGTNGFGKTGWGGPCPPSGTHHYRFRLLAIRQPVGLTGAPRAGDVLAATEGQVGAEATLSGTYRR